MAACLSLRNVTIERNEQRLFHALTLQCSLGQAWQIIGPNGSGKSSLLKVLSGLSKPRRGLIQWQQQNTVTSQAWLRQHALYLRHELCLKMQLTVRENLRLFAALQETPLLAQDLFEQCLQDFDLTALADRLVLNLSAGQQRRVNLAKLGLSTAKVWLLDEPFTALDQAQCTKLSHRLENFVAQQGLVIFTSHQTLHFTRLTSEACYLEPLT